MKGCDAMSGAKVGREGQVEYGAARKKKKKKNPACCRTSCWATSSGAGKKKIFICFSA